MYIKYYNITSTQIIVYLNNDKPENKLHLHLHLHFIYFTVPYLAYLDQLGLEEQT